MTALPPLASLLATLPLPAPMLALEAEGTPVELPGFPDLLESIVEAVENPGPAAPPPKGEARSKPQRGAPDPTDSNGFILAAMLQVPAQQQPPEPPVKIPDADWTVAVQPMPEPAVAGAAEPLPLRIKAPESVAAEVRAEPQPVLPPETNAARESPVAQPRRQETEPETIEVRAAASEAVRMTAPRVEPRVSEDRRPEAKPRAERDHAPEPLDQRTATPRPAHSAEDTPTRDEGRNSQEPLSDRRIRAAAPRTESDQLAATEPRGEVAFSARLVPIAPEATHTPAEPAIQVREKPPASATPLPQAPQDAPKSLPLREIRLEVDRGERKVEVQLIERAGDVRVAVRTPDVRLATEIRDNLPALSSRLEQSGYRTETWHGSQDGSRHTGQDDREHPQRQPQEQPPPEESPKRKQKGQQFAWLMSSLR